MNNFSIKILKVLSIITFVALTVACSKGPAEETGETVDEAVEDMGNDVEDACEKAKEVANLEDKDC